MAKSIPASATEVRTYFVDNPKKVPAGDKTVGKAPSQHRGRLSPDAVKVFEKETGKTYVVGTRDDLIEVSFHYTQPSGKKAKATERLTVKEIRSLAGEVAKPKGRLTEAAMEAARASLGERKTAASAAAKAGKAKKVAAPAKPVEVTENTPDVA